MHLRGRKMALPAAAMGGAPGSPHPPEVHAGHANIDDEGVAHAQNFIVVKIALLDAARFK
jgi:hypothetical protein